MKKITLLSFKFIICILIAVACVLHTFDFTVVNASALSSYDLRDYGAVTSVKNQGNANTCWAFAAIGAIESSLIMGGFADASIDLSETHLSWFAINSAISDESNLTYGDGLNVSNPLQYGGNDLFVIWSIARGFGLELEEFAKYNEEYVDDLKVKENARYVSEFNVTSVNLFEKTEITKIKKAITENGALMASYLDTSRNYNRGTQGYCFYDSSATSTNHATLIVGWDDNFSRDNFGATKPASDGAWLCRNTRGESFGDSGYFWMSYETSSLKRIVSFIAEPAEDDIYQIYQYDGYGYSKSAGLDSSGVIYTSNIFDVSENGALEKVAFYSTAPNLKNEIYIYSLNENYTSPTDGTLVSHFTHDTDFAGYCLVDLPQCVKVNANGAFSVVIKTSGEGMVRFYSEGTENRTSVKGKSFASSDGKSWKDPVEYSLGNICIKAWVNPDIYEGPNMSLLCDIMEGVKDEYYENKTLSTLLSECKNLCAEGGSERDVLNNYLRLICLYEKYCGYVTIENEEQFITFANMVNGGASFYDTVIVLTNDLDFSNYNYVMPSGFNGIFNGKFHTISGINYSSQKSAGLFGYLYSESCIKNLVISDSYFASESNVGTFAFWNEGGIYDCSAKVMLDSVYQSVGAFVSYNCGRIENCAFINPDQNKKIALVCNNTSGEIVNCITSGAMLECNGNEPVSTYNALIKDDIIKIDEAQVQRKSVLSVARLFSTITELGEGLTYTGDKVGTLKVSLIGDIYADCSLDTTDYILIKSSFLEMLCLNEAQTKSADVNKDGEITSTDYLLIKSHFLGQLNIYGVKK